MNDPLLAYLPSTLRHQHQRRAAHVKAQLAGAPTAAEQPTGPAAHAFAEAAQSAAANCDRLLGLLSPQAAITQWYNIDSRTRAALEHIKGLDRMRWVLAVAARGTSTDQQHVDEFFTNAAQWCAAKLHEGSYQVPVSGDPHWDLSVGAMPQRQFVERISSVGIRYHWACKAIATQIARIVSDDCAFAAELPELTVDNVERLFTTVRNHNDGDPLIPHDQSPALAVLMAVDSGALGGRPFAEMAISTKMRTQPWVRFADGLIPARDLLLFALERPLLAIVDARVGPLKRKKVTKGELYERVVQACIQGAIGRGCRDFPREYSITPEGGRERDIDFALIDTEVRVVGEVKAMESSEGIDAAASNFEEQIGEVYQQLHARLGALDGGRPLTDGAGTEHKARRNKSLGLGVVLHPYSSSLGDPRMLTYTVGDADPARIGIADLHGWLLVLHGLDRLQDLRKYLQFREDLRAIGALSFDETDTAVAYFSPGRDAKLRRHQHQVASARANGNHVVAAVAAYGVAMQRSLDCPAPDLSHRDRWRRQLFTDAETLPW